MEKGPSFGGGAGDGTSSLLIDLFISFACVCVCVCVAGPSACTSSCYYFFHRRRRTPKSQTSPFGRRFIINHAGGWCNECVCVRKRSVQTGESVRAKTAAHQSPAYRFPTTPPSPRVSIRRRRNSIYYTFLFSVPAALPESTRTIVPGINITPVKVRAFDGEISSCTRAACRTRPRGCYERR